jgi:hypothetical protein
VRRKNGSRGRDPSPVWTVGRSRILKEKKVAGSFSSGTKPRDSAVNGATRCGGGASAYLLKVLRSRQHDQIANGDV